MGSYFYSCSCCIPRKIVRSRARRFRGRTFSVTEKKSALLDIESLEFGHILDDGVEHDGGVEENSVD
jgi:hypothetical protein